MFMKLSKFLSLTEIIMLSFIAILGFAPVLLPMADGVPFVVLILAFFAVGAFLLYSLTRLSLESFKKVRIDQNEEDYHLYLEKFEKVYVSPKAGSLGFTLSTATITLFFLQTLPEQIWIPYRSIPFLKDLAFEKYLLILWVMWHAWVGSRNYFYKRISLSKK